MEWHKCNLFWPLEEYISVAIICFNKQLRVIHMLTARVRKLGSLDQVDYTHAG
jgi:hypothetical protein